MKLRFPFLVTWSKFTATFPLTIGFSALLSFCLSFSSLSPSSGEEGVKHDLIPARESPFETQCVLATCHSLVLLEGDLVGDPMEKVALNAVDWNLSKGRGQPGYGIMGYWVWNHVLSGVETCITWVWNHVLSGIETCITWVWNHVL